MKLVKVLLFGNINRVEERVLLLSSTSMDTAKPFTPT
jgi:hypothetical protein